MSKVTAPAQNAGKPQAATVAKPGTAATAPLSATNVSEANDKRAQAREKRNAAKARVRKFVADNATDLGAIADDILLLAGRVRTRGTRGPSQTEELKKMLTAAGTAGVSEMDIFKAFKFGRSEMLIQTRRCILVPKPEDRVWIEFDSTTETYRIGGTGALPPAGWTGYIPAELRQL